MTRVIIFISVLLFYCRLSAQGLNATHYTEYIPVNISGDDWGTPLQLIQLVVGFLNLLFVLSVFYYNHKQNKQRNLRDINLFWYQKMILENKKDDLISFLNFVSEKIEVLKSYFSAPGGVPAGAGLQGVSSTNKEIASSKRNIVYELSYLLRVIDKEANDQFVLMLDGLQDKITSQVGKKLAGDEVDLEKLTEFVQEQRVKIFELLYKSHMKQNGP